MSDYYNEIDPQAVGWLGNLMKAGKVPQGEIDARDIRTVGAIVPQLAAEFVKASMEVIFA